MTSSQGIDIVGSRLMAEKQIIILCISEENWRIADFSKEPWIPITVENDAHVPDPNSES